MELASLTNCRETPELTVERRNTESIRLCDDIETGEDDEENIDDCDKMKIKKKIAVNDINSDEDDDPEISKNSNSKRITPNGDVINSTERCESEEDSQTSTPIINGSDGKAEVLDDDVEQDEGGDDDDADADDDVVAVAEDEVLDDNDDCDEIVIKQADTVSRINADPLTEIEKIISDDGNSDEEDDGDDDDDDGSAVLDVSSDSGCSASGQKTDGDIIEINEGEQEAMDVDEDDSKVDIKSEKDSKDEKSVQKCKDQQKTTNVLDRKEQTIIITETKSLAKAINDAVKQPDGKPTLVIIETKPGVSQATASTTKSTSSSNGVVLSAKLSSSTTAQAQLRRLTPGLSTLQNQLSAEFNGGRAFGGINVKPIFRPSPASLLQGGLLATSLTRFAPKPEPGPSVPLPDDAEVSVDVPSLVVPYLFECQARETLTHFLKKLGPLEEVIDLSSSPTKTIVQMSPTAAAIDAVARGSSGRSYFDSTLGKFLMDIGLLQVQDWVQGEILKAQQRKLNRGWRTKERERMVAGLKRTMEESKHRTGQFRFTMRKCPRCAFHSESSIVVDKHMETIHLAPGSSTRMVCCYCDYTTDVTASIFNHVYVKHDAFARLEKFNNCHMCPLCPFEDANKSRVTRHAWKCQKAYVPERNLAPATDFEPPAKRTRLVASVATLKNMSAARQQQQQQQQQNAQLGNVLRDNLMGRGGATGPPPIRPKPGETRITPSYVQSVLRSSYVPPSQAGSRSVSQLLTSAHNQYVRSASAPGPRVSSPGNSLMMSAATRNQLSGNMNQPYTIQPSQLYQVVNQGAGVLPVVRGTVGAFQSTPRFTILPTQPATVTTRGPTPVALIPNLAASGGQSSSFANQLRSAASAGSNAMQMRNASGVTRPNISITPVNKSTSGASRQTTITSLSSGSRPSQQQNQQQQQQQQQQQGASGSGSSYVVCEICDGYIKDLDQLRNHMQWIHKVKIHPKMIHNRPPLNCQKCHYRFFTDQGLERHLLGSHGLVTSSMQDNANKGKDGGRCIICGKVFLWKLVVHMAKDHKMTLKPAHLSYKCTVCSATFNMYRLFETHVYEEHSTVAKRVLDTPKSAASSALNANANKSKTSVSSSKDVVTVRSVTSSSSSVTVTETKAAIGAVHQITSTSCPSPIKACIECGIKFQCSSNCLDHLKESHVRPCRVKLCRVDKCQKCTNKSKEKKDEDEDEDIIDDDEVELVEDDDDDIADDNDVDDDVIIELDVKCKDAKTAATSATTVTTPLKRKQVVIVRREDQPVGDDVFDMEVETVDDDHHSSPGSVHTDVESD